MRPQNFQWLVGVKNHGAGDEVMTLHIGYGRNTRLTGLILNSVDKVPDHRMHHDTTARHCIGPSTLCWGTGTCEGESFPVAGLRIESTSIRLAMV